MRGMMIFWLLTYALLLATPVWAGDYTAGNDMVTDNDTGLIWQQQDDGQVRNWEGAIAYCEGLTLANQSDWRLPNIKELESITDDSRYNPAIDPVFTDAKAFFYWSSTTYAYDPSSAWVVYFFDGLVYGGVYFCDGYVCGISKGDGNYYVRCVRAGQ